ncbi:hypothetical protein D9758_009133 [Tetrapyrgos nigripes]|uniref:Uncharacterized protein n=1 Tax=Tetrapyrgos nigripes TaxID=182062 RepID=A0A8H5LK37_9AGAR|nr:hypothetical protein D9758_009133 [Tetrapyrgos nigripes]
MSSLNETQVNAVLQNVVQCTRFRVFPLLVETFLWASYTLLIVASTYILLSRGIRSRPKKIMLALTLAMYALSTLDWAIDVRHVWTDLEVSIPGQLVDPTNVEMQASVNRMSTLLRVVQAFTNNICVLLGDIVVCWRVSVVYKNDKWVFWTAVAWLVILAPLLLTCNLTQIGVGFPNITHLHVLAGSQLYIDIFALSVSALINIWATVMIALKAWRSRYNLRLFLLKSSRKTFAESIMTLFVESGIIYSVAWIAKNVIIVPQVANTSYTNYAIMIMNQVVGMYPTIILVLVALHKSHTDHSFTYVAEAGPDRVGGFMSGKPSTYSTALDPMSSIQDGTILVITERRMDTDSTDLTRNGMNSCSNFSGSSRDDVCGDKEIGRVTGMEGA